MATAGSSMEAGSLGQWFSGFVALCVLFYYVYRDYVDAPKLDVCFDPTRDATDQTSATTRDGRGLLGYSRWLRVLVTNTAGRKTAKNCRGFLTKIERISPSGKPVLWTPNDCRQLTWTHDRGPVPSGRDLLPKIGHWLDVARTLASAPGLLYIECFPDAVEPGEGEYLFHVQVSAEGTDSSIIFKLRVMYDGQNLKSLTGSYESKTVLSD